MHRVRHFVKINAMPTSGRNNLYFKIKNLFKSFPVAATEGFTLIELLIVVAITGVLSTVILANFNSFGARQEVRNVAEEFKTELRKYQTFAIAGQKNPLRANPADTNCVSTPGTLDGYVLIIVDDGFTGSEENHYTVALRCPGYEFIFGTFPDIWKRISSNDSMIISDVGSVSTSCLQNYLAIKFRTLNQGTQLSCSLAFSTLLPSAYIRISNTDGTTEYEITVTQTGEINVKKL